MSSDGLAIQDVVCRRGHSRILQGVTLTAQSGVVGLIGRNGMGKSTLAECAMGMLPATSGTVTLNGQQLSGLRPDQIARCGLALVPQGRRLFPSLSVREHLQLAGARGGKWSPDDVRALFPRLTEREGNRANQLSGGEQQMLAIARALLQSPSAIIMDEPSEGLAPVIVDELAATISRLAQDGMVILLIEQNLSLVERTVTQPVYVMENGLIVDQIDQQLLRDDRGLRERVLGVSADFSY